MIIKIQSQISNTTEYYLFITCNSFIRLKTSTSSFIVLVCLFPRSFIPMAEH